MDAKQNRTSAIGLALAAGGALLLARSAFRHAREYSFDGKVVLITGSSRGLGLVMARQLAAEGARLVICARDEGELEVARQELQAQGAHVLAITCDLTDPEKAKQLVARAEEHFGPIDVLINNAGTISVSPIEHITLDDYHEAMNVNFWAAVNVAYHVVPHMQKRRSGRVVNISSIGGKIAVPHLIPYSASKFALSGWSRGLRAELAKDNVIVTTVCPGLMRTGSPRNANFKGQHKLEYAWFKYGDSLPGISVSAEEAAKQILGATRRGDVELIIGAAVKFAALVDGLFPQFSGELASVAARLLPGPGGIGEETRKGHESETAGSRNWFTSLTDTAAAGNNQVKA